MVASAMEQSQVGSSRHATAAAAINSMRNYTLNVFYMYDKNWLFNKEYRVCPFAAAQFITGCYAASFIDRFHRAYLTAGFFTLFGQAGQTIGQVRGNHSPKVGSRACAWQLWQLGGRAGGRADMTINCKFAHFYGACNSLGFS
jgi:hypothetical protein